MEAYEKGGPALKCSLSKHTTLPIWTHSIEICWMQLFGKFGSKNYHPRFALYLSKVGGSKSVHVLKTTTS